MLLCVAGPSRENEKPYGMSTWAQARVSGIMTGVRHARLPLGFGSRYNLFLARERGTRPIEPESGRRGGQSMAKDASVQVGIVMGSTSDWPTLEHAAKTLEALKVPFETRVVSAHRTPDLLFEYAESAAERGLRAIIAGAGGAAHLPGMLASKTWLPILGVPVQSKALRGMDSLLSIVQMPAGVPVGTLAIGRSGAVNAALLAASMIATTDVAVRKRLEEWRAQQTADVLADSDPALSAIEED